jgi:hypothetical protein
MKKTRMKKSKSRREFSSKDGNAPTDESRGDPEEGGTVKCLG